jgi:hypothetical protein
MFESMGDSGNGAGRRKRKIASRKLPHGSVEADILVEEAHFDQRWHGTSWAWAWACLTFVHRRNMPSCESIFEITTSSAANPFGGTGMDWDARLWLLGVVWLAPRSLFFILLR